MACERQGNSVRDLDLIAPHQANARINPTPATPCRQATPLHHSLSRILILLKPQPVPTPLAASNPAGIRINRAKEMTLSNPAFRLMTVAATALVCSLTAAAAQSPLHRQPGQKEKQTLAEQIASDGLNCPVVGVVDDAGKDDRGTMIRIHCSSLNGAASWDVRGIAAKDAAGLRFESW
jgi:hypothetical protein